MKLFHSLCLILYYNHRPEINNRMKNVSTKINKEIRCIRQVRHTLVNPLYCSHFLQVQLLRSMYFIQKFELQNQQLTRQGSVDLI